MVRAVGLSAARRDRPASPEQSAPRTKVARREEPEEVEAPPRPDPQEGGSRYKEREAHRSPACISPAG